MLQPRSLAALAVLITLLGFWLLRSGGISTREHEPTLAEAAGLDADDSTRTAPPSPAAAAALERAEVPGAGGRTAGGEMRVLVHDPHGILEQPFRLKVYAGKEWRVPDWMRSGGEFRTPLNPAAGAPFSAAIELQGDFVGASPAAVGRFEQTPVGRPEESPSWLTRIDLEQAVCVIDFTLHDTGSGDAWTIAHPWQREGILLPDADLGSQSIRAFASRRGYLELRLAGTWAGDVYRVRFPLNSARTAREIKVPTGAVTVHVDPALLAKNGEPQKVILEAENRIGGGQLRRLCECDSEGTVRFMHLPPGRYGISTLDKNDGFNFVGNSVTVDQSEEIVYLKYGSGTLRVAFEPPAPEAVIAFAADWPRYPMVAFADWDEGAGRAEFKRLAAGSWRVLGFRQGARATGQAFVSTGDVATLERLAWRPSVQVNLILHTAFEGHDTGRMEVCVTDADGFSYVEDFVANRDVAFTYESTLQLPPGPLQVAAFHESGLIGEGVALVPARHEGVATVDVWILFREP